MAKSTTNPLGDLSVVEDEPFEKTARSGGAPDKAPDGERFAMANYKAVDVRDGETEIGDLVSLQVHLHIPERAQKERLVLDDGEGKFCSRLVVSIHGRPFPPIKPSAKYKIFSTE